MKAISAFLFLLLKHFKLNHVFQVRLKIGLESFRSMYASNTSPLKKIGERDLSPIFFQVRGRMYTG